MNRRTAAVVTTLSLLATAGILTAGPLNPPAGPVTSTYKTLTDVEPRIAINAANTPGDGLSVYRITQRGSYYLTGNVNGVVGKHGIKIEVPGVTIDLNGYEVDGTAGSYDGIHSDATSSVVIRNGRVLSWGASGINMLASNGVTVEDVTASNNGIYGVHAGLISRISRCHTEGNGHHGIWAEGRSLLTDCVSNNNGEDGIHAEFATTVERCVSSDNGDDGIEVGANCRVHGNTCLYNDPAGSGAGIYATGVGSEVSDNTLNSNHYGVLTSSGAAGTLVIRNTLTANASSLQLYATTIAGPTVTAATILSNSNPAANYVR